MKRIYFCLDIDSYYKQLQENRGAIGYYDYKQTEHGIKKGLSPIVTYQIALISFRLIDDGYEVYLCYKDKAIQIKDELSLENGIWLHKPYCSDDADILEHIDLGHFKTILGIDKEEQAKSLF